jgi:hypothetical protein
MPIECSPTDLLICRRNLPPQVIRLLISSGARLLNISRVVIDGKTQDFHHHVTLPWAFVEDLFLGGGGEEAVLGEELGETEDPATQVHPIHVRKSYQILYGPKGEEM